jgi:hypothetical protein
MCVFRFTSVSKMNCWLNRVIWFDPEFRDNYLSTDLSQEQAVTKAQPTSVKIAPRPAMHGTKKQLCLMKQNQRNSM